MTTTHSVRLALVSMALFGVAACAKKDEVKSDTTTTAMASPPPPVPTPVPSVSTIETGKHITANRRVDAAESTFSPKDTIYLAVVTENPTPTSSLIAKWTSENGKLVDSTMQSVAPADPANNQSVTAFHLAKAKGMAAGTYKVELWLDGTSAGTRDVIVKK